MRRIIVILNAMLKTNTTWSNHARLHSKTIRQTVRCHKSTGGVLHSIPEPIDPAQRAPPSHLQHSCLFRGQASRLSKTQRSAHIRRPKGQISPLRFKEYVVSTSCSSPAPPSRRPPDDSGSTRSHFSVRSPKVLPRRILDILLVLISHGEILSECPLREERPHNTLGNLLPETLPRALARSLKFYFASVYLTRKLTDPSDQTEWRLAADSSRLFGSAARLSAYPRQTRSKHMRLRPTCAYALGRSDHRSHASRMAAKSHRSSPAASTRSTSNV